LGATKSSSGHVMIATMVTAIARKERSLPIGRCG
jgi:hypothetical protein